MNGNFFSTPTFPTNNKEALESPPGNINFSNTFAPMEQSYIENILRLNKGKKVKVYYSYPDSNEWKDKIYEGII